MSYLNTVLNELAKNNSPGTEELYKLNEALFNMPEADYVNARTATYCFNTVEWIRNEYNGKKIGQRDSNFFYDYVGLLGTLQNQAFLKPTQKHEVAFWVNEALSGGQKSKASQRQVKDDSKAVKATEAEIATLRAELAGHQEMSKALSTIAKFKSPKTAEPEPKAKAKAEPKMMKENGADKSTVQIVDGKAGLQKVLLKRSSGASAEVYVYAAHVTSWKSPDGKEQLFMSSKAEYGGGKALRGGIPICWPQFAARGPYGKHGFCRNSDKWKVAKQFTRPNPKVVLELESDDDTMKVYPFAFKCRYIVTLASDKGLTTALQVVNPSSDAPLEFTCALHTYFAASNISSVGVDGLEGCEYEDNTAGGKVSKEMKMQVQFDGEVDRVYLNAGPIQIVDGKNILSLKKKGFKDAVVWNIGKDKAGSIGDLGDGEWAKYVCVEAGSVGEKVVVPANGSWTGEQRFAVK